MWEKKETTTQTCESQQSLGDRGKIRSPLCNRCSGFVELLLIYIPAGCLFLVCLFSLPTDKDDGVAMR